MKSAAAALLAIICAASAMLAAEGGPLPYDLAVEVAYTDPPGPLSLREELEWEIVKVLEMTGCFRSVDSYSADKGRAEILLTVSISNLIDEQEYELSLAQRDSPRRSDGDSVKMASRLEADFDLRLSILPQMIPFHTRRLHKNLRYRQHSVEDPRDEVQLMMIEKVAMLTSAFACKNKKLRGQIERARAGKSLDD